MNVETNTGVNMNDPAVLEERVASMVNTLIQITDPRLIVNALLSNAAALTQLVLRAEKATPAQVAQAFSSAMVDALSPPVQEVPRIEVVPASSIIDLKTRR